MYKSMFQVSFQHFHRCRDNVRSLAATSHLDITRVSHGAVGVAAKIGAGAGEPKLKKRLEKLPENIILYPLKLNMERFTYVKLLLYMYIYIFIKIIHISLMAVQCCKHQNVGIGVPTLPFFWGFSVWRWGENWKLRKTIEQPDLEPLF